MRRFHLRRPSGAMAVSIVALVMATTGTAVATHERIFSTDIVDGTIQGRDIGLDQVAKGDVGNNAFGSREAYDGAIGGIDIKQNDLTGADINEATLGPVPRANTVGGQGVAKLNFRGPAGTGETTVLNVSGLHLTAECLAGGNLVVRARSTQNGGYLLASGHDLSYRDAGNNQGRAGGDVEFNNGNLVNVTEQVGNGDGNNDIGHLTYAGAGGAVINVQFLMDEGNVVGGCAFTGHALFG